ncbi:MAG: FAD-dependent oxidoreductase [Vicinamibacterales bacterium]
MALVKLEIDGKRIIADSSQTILQAARQHGVGDIPTLCHDGQLEPFSSCFLCVVKVKGARTLVPACSTRVSNGMVVQTSTADIRESRKTALELLLSNHYADCVGPCELACPAGVDVQGYIALAAIGEYRDAVRLIKERNPLPSVCGRVCTRPCEVKGCRRSMLDEAVGIDYIKRYLTDLDLGGDGFRPKQAPPNGKRVAVVGAGPAGLSASYYLALKGYQVDLFESQPEAGGMLRYGIPEYRLPKDVLDLEIHQILALGVRLRTNTRLGRDFTVASLRREGYAAVFLAIGAWRSSLMRVRGEDTLNVISGIEFLEKLGLRKKVDLSGRVVVVGGGNTAIDCARTAVRLGVSEVKILYRRTRNEMPANASEIHEAEQEGVKIEFLVAPVRVLTDGGRLAGLECLRMELGEPDQSGRRSPKPIRGSEFVVPCDYVLSAIGQTTTIPDLVDGRVPGFLPMGEVLNLTRWQTVQVDPKTFETSVEGVFSGGDVVTGAATAIEAIAAGRKAAYAIDKYVATGVARPEPEEFYSRKDAFGKVTLEDLRSRVGKPRRIMPVAPVEERVKTFAEVEQGYTADDLRHEVQRCMECGCVSLFDCDLRRYATEYGVDFKRFIGEASRHAVDSSHPLIELDQNKCILCGRCVRVCSHVVGLDCLGFVNRGFATVVAPPLGGSLLDTECVTCGLCVATCPTGAIEQKVSLSKPGPWKTEKVDSVCHYCGVGCRIGYQVFGKTLVKAARNDSNPVLHGNHCRKGRFGTEFIRSPERLRRGRIRPGRQMQETPVADAIEYAAMRLKEVGRRHSPSEVAVFVSPRLTNEEIYLAQKFARVALRTHNVTSFSRLLNPQVTDPPVLATASYADLADAQAVVVVNSNTSAEHFVVDLLAKRSIRGGGRLIYIGSQPNLTSRFAEVFLQVPEGMQYMALLAVLAEYERLTGETIASRPTGLGAVSEMPAEALEEATGAAAADVKTAAKILSSSILKVLVFNRDFRGRRRAGDNRFLAQAAAALGCGLLPLHEKANGQGLLDMGADPRWYPGYRPVGDGQTVDALEKEWCAALDDLDTNAADVGMLLRDKKIKVAIILGEDPLGAEGLPEDLRAGLADTDLLVVGDLFMTETARAADVVLPISSPVETSGTFTNAERRVQRVRRAVPPAAGMETWQIICELAAHMGHRFKMKYSGPDEIFEEIRRTAPIYRDVVIDSCEEDGIWSLDGNSRAASEAESPLGEALTPAGTLALDHLEVCFERWFQSLFAKARKAREQEVHQSWQ